MVYDALADKPLRFIRSATIPPRIKAVIFDWDNTLAKNSEAYRKEYFIRTFYAMKDKGYIVPQIFELTDVGDNSTKKYFELLWGPDGAKVALGMMNEIYSGIPMSYELMPGADETLRQLTKRNIPIAILSSRSHAEVEKAAQILLGKEFENISILGMDDAGLRKPDPRAYQNILKKLNISASKDVYMVGDHPTIDVCSARECGLTPIHFGRDTRKSYAVYEETPATHKSIIKHSAAVADHQELQALFDSIYRGMNVLPIFRYSASIA